MSVSSLLCVQHKVVIFVHTHFPYTVSIISPYLFNLFSLFFVNFFFLFFSFSSLSYLFPSFYIYFSLVLFHAALPIYTLLSSFFTLGLLFPAIPILHLSSLPRYLFHASSFCKSRVSCMYHVFPAFPILNFFSRLLTLFVPFHCFLLFIDIFSLLNQPSPPAVYSLISLRGPSYLTSFYHCFPSILFIKFVIRI